MIECADLASIGNKEISQGKLPHAINAFKFDKSAQTCVAGKINYMLLADMTSWPALTGEDVEGIHLLYDGCEVKGRLIMLLIMFTN